MIEIPFLLFYLTQGDRGNGMYFVETGTLVVLKQIDGEEKEVKHKNIKKHCQDEMFPCFNCLSVPAR